MTDRSDSTGRREEGKNFNESFLSDLLAFCLPVNILSATVGGLRGADRMLANRVARRRGRMAIFGRVAPPLAHHELTLAELDHGARRAEDGVGVVEVNRLAQ